MKKYEGDSFTQMIVLDRPVDTTNLPEDERSLIELLYVLFEGKNLEFFIKWWNLVFRGLMIRFIVLPYLGREQQRIFVRMVLEDGTRIKAVFEGENTKDADFASHVYIVDPPLTADASAIETKALEAMYVLFREQHITFVTNWLNKNIGDPHGVYFVSLPLLTPDQEKLKLKILLEQGTKIKVTVKRPKFKKKPKGAK
jgi:hypothetical protein